VNNSAVAQRYGVRRRERNVMNSVPEISRWQGGRIDRTKDHFEPRYGSVQKGSGTASAGQPSCDTTSEGWK
jgi:hypothetical protein